MLFQHDETMRRLGNNEELLREFVQIFREDSPGIIESLKRAVESGDSNAFGKSAHAVKGLVANFGAEKAVALAADMETAEFDAGCSKAKSSVEEFENLVQQLDEELAKALDS